MAKGLALMTQIGLTSALCVGLGVLAGRLLDGWLGTSPWLLFLFALLGCAAAFKSMLDIAKKV